MSTLEELKGPIMPRRAGDHVLESPELAARLGLGPVAHDGRHAGATLGAAIAGTGGDPAVFGPGATGNACAPGAAPVEAGVRA